MDIEHTERHSRLNIHHYLRLCTFLVIILATFCTGETEMDQSSADENIFRNVMSSVTSIYPRESRQKLIETSIITVTKTKTQESFGDSMIFDTSLKSEKNADAEFEIGANITMSIISTTSNQSSGTIVTHPTISYLDTDTVNYISNRGFTTPHFHISDARWGPFFEEGTEPQNITANLGSTVIFDCRIGLLHDKTVTWLHHKDDSIHLLTVGKNVYSSDERITLSFRYPNNWRLIVVYVSTHDEGLYECQVATHPPKVKRLHLRILVPEIFLLDELGREFTERYYKEGSTFELTCLGVHTDYMDNNIQQEITWRRGDREINEGISFNTSASNAVVTSTLVLNPIERHHSGNYTCSINGLSSATVSIHVLNGESPAAVMESNMEPNKFNMFSALICVLCIVYR